MSAWRDVLRHLFRDRVGPLLDAHDLAEIAEKAGMPWPPRNCIPDSPCSVWNPRGDRPVAVWCRRHCPDCRRSERGHVVAPCVAHDMALYREIEPKGDAAMTRPRVLGYDDLYGYLEGLQAEAFIDAAEADESEDPAERAFHAGRASAFTDLIAHIERVLVAGR